MLSHARVLLSTARPTSPASDRTKGGGSVGCTENTEVRCRERKIRIDEDTALIQIESKSPKEFAKKFRDATGEPREKRLLPITNSKAYRQRDLTSLHTDTEKRSGRAAPEILEEQVTRRVKRRMGIDFTERGLGGFGSVVGLLCVVWPSFLKRRVSSIFPAGTCPWLSAPGNRLRFCSLISTMFALRFKIRTRNTSLGAFQTGSCCEAHRSRVYSKY